MALAARKATPPGTASRTLYDRNRPEWWHWYNSTAWRKRSKQQLTEHPLCAECERQGLLTPGCQADHVIPHRGNEDLFWNGRLESLCLPCHARKTRKGL